MTHLLLHDLRAAIRGLRRSPAFSLVAILTLTLGIGLTTAMFSVVNAIVLRPLPYAQPEQLVRVWGEQTTSKALFERIRGTVGGLQGVAAYHVERAVLSGVDEPRELVGVAVSAGFFDVLGVAPAEGGGLRPDGNAPRRGDEVVVSHRVWTEVFGRDPSVIGRRVRLGEAWRTVVGVAPARHRALVPGTEFWVPFTMDRSNFSDFEGLARLRLVGRLVPGVTAETVTAQLSGLAAAVQLEAPEALDEAWVRDATAIPLGVAESAHIAATLWTLLGAVAFVLLIACANVANLLLARGGTRETELAVRAGLGASRAALVRQLVTEALVLAGLGGAAGVATAAVIVRVVRGHLPAGVVGESAIPIDGVVLSIALAATAVATLACGVVPAFRITGNDTASALRAGGRSATGARRQMVDTWLIAAQMAAAVVLMTGAGLMFRTMQHVANVDLGFASEHVVTMRISPPQDGRYADGARRAALYAEMGLRIAAIPQVRAAGLVSALPAASGATATLWNRPEQPDPPGVARRFTRVQLVTPGYFEALQIPTRSGRALSASDRAGSREVAVINQTLVGQAFADGDPLGRRLELFGGGATVTVVGVVADVRQQRPDQPPEAEVFLPYQQVSFYSRMSLAVRTTEDAGAAVPAIRQVIRDLEPGVAVSDVRSLASVVSDATNDARFVTALLGGFAASALALSALGVYGVLSCMVGRRMPEFGLRLALGATSQHIVTEALRRAGAPVAIGLGAGLAAALAATELLRDLLYGVSPRDPLTMIVVAAVLVAAAAGASYLPARRALQVDVTRMLDT